MPTSGSSSSCNTKNACCTDQTSSSTTSSSIGKNSDLSEEGLSEKFGDGEEEVQSKCKGGVLDAMDALEEVLPMRRGISRFYNGKSKTFASLVDASLSSSSVKEIAKPNNAYARRQRNLLAHSLRGNANGSISKRATGSGRVPRGLAMVMTSSESDFSSNDSSWRSYSLSDLQQQQCAAAGVEVSCSNLYAKPT